MSAIIVNDKNNYGFSFPETYLQPHIELFGYAITRGSYGKHLQDKILHAQGLSLGDFRFRTPFEHLMNFIKLGWPTEVEINVRGYTNRPMLRVLEALCEYDDLGIAGNAGSSKSFSVAVWTLVDWFAAPNVTSTFMASTSLESQSDRVWGHTSRLFKCCKFATGSYLDYKKSIVCETSSEQEGKEKDRDYLNSIKALAFPPGNEGKKAVDTTRGRHNKRVRMVVDELPEMEMYVNKVRANLASNVDFIYVGIGNPSLGENPHRELCKPDDPRGWDSINENVPQWKTRTGHCIFLHGQDSPNFECPENEPPPFPYLQTRKSLETILNVCYGNKKSLEYYRNAVGFWAPEGTQTTIMTSGHIQAANINYEPLWRGEKHRLATLDCAQTAGGDRNILSFGFIAQMREEQRSALMYQGSKDYMINVGDVFEQSLAKQIVEDLIKLGVKPIDFGMDIEGGGGKILSAIIQEWIQYDSSAAQIVAIGSSGKPTERTVSSMDKRKAINVYDRLVSEYWFSVYHALSSRCVFGLSVDNHSELVSELCSREYTIRNKKTSIETKPEMKVRMGKSPDRGDSFTYLIELARRRGMTFIVEPQNAKPDPTLHESNVIEVDFAYAGAGDDPDGF